MPNHWLTDIETELHRIRPGENPGRTRTIARRIAGFALRHFYTLPDEDVLRLMASAMKDTAIPDNIRQAVERLAARLDAQFNSPSTDPIGDAMSIVNFVKQKDA